MCVNPLHIRNNKLELGPYDAEFLDVPCGKCVECQQSKKLEWLVRSMAHANGYFDKGLPVYYYTLTYNQKYVPTTLCKLDDGSLKRFPCFSKKHLQKFLCSLRTLLNRIYNISFTYIITCEYGDNTSRSHYHCLFFLNGFVSHGEFRRLVSRCWSNKIRVQKRIFGTRNKFLNLVRYDSFGYNKPGKYGGLVTKYDTRAIEYVCKYITKQFDDNSRYVDFLLKHSVELEISDIVPFHLQSTRFGLYMLSDVQRSNFKDLTYRYVQTLEKDDASFELKNKIIKFPRYILQHYLYNKYINLNGNVSYILSPFGVSHRCANLDNEVSKLLDNILELKSYPLEFFKVDSQLFNELKPIYENFHSLPDYLSSLVDLTFLCEYRLFYRDIHTQYLSNDLKFDFLFTHSDLPFMPKCTDGRMLDTMCEYSLTLLHRCNRVRKYLTYIDNVRVHNEIQRRLSTTSHRVKLIDELSFNDYCLKQHFNKNEYFDSKLGLSSKNSTAATGTSPICD